MSSLDLGRSEFSQKRMGILILDLCFLLAAHLELVTFSCMLAVVLSSQRVRQRSIRQIDEESKVGPNSLPYFSVYLRGVPIERRCR
jgi:hypothetical protein